MRTPPLFFSMILTDLGKMHMGLKILSFFPFNNNKNIPKYI